MTEKYYSVYEVKFRRDFFSNFQLYSDLIYVFLGNGPVIEIVTEGARGQETEEDAQIRVVVVDLQDGVEIHGR